MIDLEMVKKCAEQMGYSIVAEPNAENEFKHTILVKELRVGYCPLHDDAQAMALVKKFGIEIHCRSDRNGWYVGIFESDGMTANADLNRAIVECVSKLKD